MSLARMDWTVQDGLGRALAGAQVFWCTQPATVPSTPPPSPLASVYADIDGATPITQPVLSDGFGHVDAYMDDSILYTVVIYHPLFGQNPLVYPDQAVNGPGGTTGLTPFAGTPTGTINGTNRTFVVVNGSTPLTALPSQITAWLDFPLIKGLGYTLAVVSGQLQITFAVAPQPASGGNPADSIYAQGLYTP
jgi:hypothetical protein